MAIKYREAEELRLTTRKNLTAAPENWMRFLRTLSRPDSDCRTVSERNGGRCL